MILLIYLGNKHNPFNELKKFPAQPEEESDNCGMQKFAAPPGGRAP